MENMRQYMKSNSLLLSVCIDGFKERHKIKRLSKKRVVEIIEAQGNYKHLPSLENDDLKFVFGNLNIDKNGKKYISETSYYEKLSYAVYWLYRFNNEKE